MSTPGPDPLPRLAQALVQVSGHLREIGDELRTLQVLERPAAVAAPQPAPQPPPDPRPAMPPSVARPTYPQPMYGPPQFGPPQFGPPQFGPQYAPPQRYFPPQAPPRPQSPPPYPRPTHAGPPAAPMVQRAPGPTLWDRLSKEGAGAKLLAWVGGGVTLAGVVLLLVLAVQRGYIGPLPRLVLGGALGAVLVGIGLFLNRKPSGRVGALAVAGTGFAGLFFDVVAATSIYSYLPAAVGLLAGLAVAVAATAVAVRWDSELLVVFALAGCAISAPVLTDGFGDVLLVGFLLVLQIAAAPMHLYKRWTTLALVSSVPPILAVVAEFAVTASTGRGPDAVTVLALCLAATVVQLAVSVAVAVRNSDDHIGAGMLLSAPLPMLLAASLVEHRVGAAALGLVALLFALVFLAQRIHLVAVPPAFGLCAGAGAAVTAFESVSLAFAGDVRTAALLAGGVLLAVLAERLRMVQALVPALVFAGIGAMTGLTRPLGLRRLVRAPSGDVSQSATAGAMAAGVLLAAAALAIAWAAGRLLAADDARSARSRWIGAAAVSLYGATVAVFSIGLAIAPDERGFLIGHVLVTLSWTIAALVLLLRHVDSTPLRVAGLVLVGAAVVKLVLFDLSSLNGIPRVLVFLGAGLVLLAAGARYATLVADRTRTPSDTAA